MLTRLAIYNYSYVSWIPANLNRKTGEGIVGIFRELARGLKASLTRDSATIKFQKESDRERERDYCQATRRTRDENLLRSSSSSCDVDAEKLSPPDWKQRRDLSARNGASTK